MKIVAIIQARLGSSRLPKKVLLDLAGKPVIQRVYERVRKIDRVDEVVVATSFSSQNDELVEFCESIGIPVCRGSEDDVLDRYYQAAKLHGADAILRITGDCPLVDPKKIEDVIEKYLEGEYDYVSNTQPPMLPDGLDASIGSFRAFEKSWHEANLQSEREHVTQFIRNRPDLFKIGSVLYDRDFSNHRWTIDESRDYEFVINIYTKLVEKKLFGHFEEVLSILEENPDLVDLNAEIQRNEGLQKSFREDKLVRMNTNFAESGVLLERAKESIPSAASTYSKSYKYFCEGAAPAFLEKGLGSHVWDVDGNEYIDYVLALGSVLVGYNDERINKSIVDQMQNGLSFSLTNELEVILAEKLIEIIPCAEMVKFVKNGSDATSAAVRLARGYTGRDLVLCCGYHGWQDWYIGSTQNDLGVPQSVKELTITFPYGDVQALETIFSQHQGEVAAVILEPMSLELPDPGYLDQVKEIAHKNGALLIFDEIITGFRLGMAGAQGYFEVVPDMAAFGKAMGNGMAISAIVGRKDVLSLIDQGAFISTTFGGETLAIAAALKTIEIFEEEDIFERFTNLGEKLMFGMERIITKYDLKNYVKLIGLPFHFGVRFLDHGNLTTYDILSVFQQEAIKHGVLMLGVHNFSLAHTDNDINATLEAYDYAFEVVKHAIDADSVDGILLGGKFSPIFRRNSTR